MPERGKDNVAAIRSGRQLTNHADRKMLRRQVVRKSWGRRDAVVSSYAEWDLLACGRVHVDRVELAFTPDSDVTIVRKPAEARVIGPLRYEIRLVIAIEVVVDRSLRARLDVVDEQDGLVHDSAHESQALPVR